MSNLNLKEYHTMIERGDVIASFKTLKKLYRMVDNALSKVSLEVDQLVEASDLETKLLDDKDRLILLASKTKCHNIQEISHKVDFLKIAHLKEKNIDDFTLPDILAMSIWEECKVYL